MRRMVTADRVRSVIFGIEDGLVSSTGMIIGVSVGTSFVPFIILAGVATVSVEALSMGAGQFLTDRAVSELAHKPEYRNSAINGAVMFVAYTLSGAIAILPFVFLPLATARLTAITAAFISLFVLGFIKGKVLKVPAVRSGIEILVVGGIATAIGVIVGYLLRI